MGNMTVSPVNMAERQKIDVRPGDTVKVWQKVEEKGKTRLQPFEGIVLSRKHGNEAGATFTVRRTSDGYGVEKIFPLYSPIIDKIEILRRSKVRRSKLYHIREKAAREIRRQMRNMRFVNIATESDMEAKAKAEAEAQAAEEAEAKAGEEKAQQQDAPAADDTPKDDAPAEPKEEEKKEPEAEEPKDEEKKEKES